MDINAIAGTLKLYFRELPEPLLTDRFYPAFMEGIGMTFNLSPRSHFPYRISLKDCHQINCKAIRWYFREEVGTLSRSGVWRVRSVKSCPRVLAALSDPAAKENCMMHLLRSLPDPNLITFLTLLEHLKRYHTHTHTQK